MKRGEVVVSNGKVFGCCAKCGKVVRMDRFLIGSLHICDPKPERPGIQLVPATQEEIAKSLAGLINSGAFESLVSQTNKNQKNA